MRRAIRALVLVALVAACGRGKVAPPASQRPAQAPAPAVPPPAAAPPPAAPPPAAPAAPTPTATAEGDEDLRAEDRDVDPRSKTVKIKLVITPAARGTVHWGRKKLADLQPGRMTVETERPRDTGPLDLLIRADGFLPHHVRLFTDRDDKLSVHLYRAGEATGLLGYRRAAATAPAP